MSTTTGSPTKRLKRARKELEATKKEEETNSSLEFNYECATALESQLLLDIKDQLVSWAELLQSIAEEGGQALGECFSGNEKLIDRIEKA